jgi:hypothetical protein
MSGGLGFYFLGGGVALAGAGLLAILRPNHLARRNRETVNSVESGHETYFEQRRAWQHYPSSRPETDPNRVRRFGWLSLVLGIAAIALSVLGGFR